MEPLGWFDERAKIKGERFAGAAIAVTPRDVYGLSTYQLQYIDRDTFDYYLIYVNALRRIRTMTATDTQDAVGGNDYIVEDGELFSQKLSPKRYPYEFKVIAEREYLLPSPTVDGSISLTSKGLEYLNLEFERRPVYVIELRQKDKSYVYSKRIIYIDKETFLIYHMENFDQAGRLYRTADQIFVFFPEMGICWQYTMLYHDRLDQHSMIGHYYDMPAPWMGREDVNLQSLVGKLK